jgi:hypothetical protein
MLCVTTRKALSEMELKKRMGKKWGNCYDKQC